MKSITLLVFKEGSKGIRQCSINQRTFIFLIILFFLGFFSSIYGMINHIKLNSLNKKYQTLAEKNKKFSEDTVLLNSQLQNLLVSLKKIKHLGGGVNAAMESLTKEKVEKKPSNKKLQKFIAKNQQKSFDPSPIDGAMKTITQARQTCQSKAIDLQEVLLKSKSQLSFLKHWPNKLPVKGWISSGFGFRKSPFTQKKKFHRGVDISAPLGTPIRAPSDGLVLFSGKKNGYGNFIIIAHYAYSIITHYGHNDCNLVHKGQKIKKNEIIATVGNTGHSTGPHLHYEVVFKGKYINPMKIIGTKEYSMAMNLN